MGNRKSDIKVIREGLHLFFYSQSCTRRVTAGVANITSTTDPPDIVRWSATFLGLKETCSPKEPKLPGPGHVDW
jgi:predicted RNA-binding protein with PUA-like domain